MYKTKNKSRNVKKEKGKGCSVTGKIAVWILGLYNEVWWESIRLFNT